MLITDYQTWMLLLLPRSWFESQHDMLIGHRLSPELLGFLQSGSRSQAVACFLPSPALSHTKKRKKKERKKRTQKEGKEKHLPSASVLHIKSLWHCTLDRVINKQKIFFQLQEIAILGGPHQLNKRQTHTEARNFPSSDT